MVKDFSTLMHFAAIKFVIQKTHGNVNNKHRQIADEIVQEWSLDKLSLTLK